MHSNIDREVAMSEAIYKYMATLYEIICDSDEPETVRKALAALTSTPEGIEFLRMNPLAL